MLTNGSLKMYHMASFESFSTIHLKQLYCAMWWPKMAPYGNLRLESFRVNLRLDHL